MNIAMWVKALQIIPRISKEEWDRLDVISKWLISTRAAVLIMTFLSAAIAGIFAIQKGEFNIINWLLVAFGLVMSHATNNLLNDYIDFTRGVDKDNYYRTQYGPQPLAHGLMNKKQLLTYVAVTGLFALAAGAVLVYLRGGLTLLFLGLGIFFVLFYTYPLKYIALGEISVLLVWGPLMIGGGYYAITGTWDWKVVIASLPYALGVTTVIFGKHIDKLQEDKAKRIYTLPVLIGEKIGRYAVLSMFILQYLFVFYLTFIGFFKPVLLIVVLSMPTLITKFLPIYRGPKPSEKPANFPDVWPNYFVAAAFVNNRTFGMWFLVGLILDAIWKVFIK